METYVSNNVLKFDYGNDLAIYDGKSEKFSTTCLDAMFNIDKTLIVNQWLE